MSTQSNVAANVAPQNRLFKSLVNTLTGRRSKWLILLVWIGILVAVSPVARRLSEVENNDASAFLPANAESLKVHELEAQFQRSDVMPAIVVYHRSGGLSSSDLARVENDRQTLAAEFPQYALANSVSSEDQQAIFYSVPLSDDDALIDDVEAIRDLVGDGVNGLDVEVTGPAGYLVDLVSVFDGVDSTLLFAAAAVVTVLLLIIYRSPFLWIIPLLAVVFAHQVSLSGVFGLAKYAGLNVNGQSGGLLPVLVFGVGTDYALLLIARYREELRRHQDKHEAMALAIRRAGPAILASGGTVVLGLLCLLAADLNSTRGLGPVGAIGVLCALAAMMTLLPAILLILGRRVFWPFIPRFGDDVPEQSGIWAKVGRLVNKRPRPIWVGTAAVLAVLAFGLMRMDANLSQAEQFSTEPDAIAGQKLIAASFPAGASAPTTVIGNIGVADAIQTAIASTPGVARVEETGRTKRLVSFAATLNAEPSSQAAFDIVKELRDNVHAVEGGSALVGGDDASSLDISTTSAQDRLVVIPVVLAVVLLILALLLRSLIAPLLLVLTVILSFAAALGTGVLVFETVFGFEGMEPSIPLLSFVFLVALGIDYNIFLMSRVHEESSQLGTRAGMLKGLAVTGGVITAAGVVLAATFSVLTVLPLVAMIELGFVVAFGVLLDTLIVRSILVPALTLDTGRWVWWPGSLARAKSSHP